MDINYAYYTSAKGYRVVNGTAAQFLKADGSVDNASYIPAGTEINMADKILISQQEVFHDLKITHGF